MRVEQKRLIVNVLCVLADVQILFVESVRWKTFSTNAMRHVTAFYRGEAHVSREIIGLCERADKWSIPYGASRTTEARFRSNISSFVSS